MENDQKSNGLARIETSQPSPPLGAAAQLLPEAERVVFDNSPLDEVVCQLRFNEILVINEAPPAAFQDKIRRAFPVFAAEKGLQIGQIGVSGQPIPVLAFNAPAWQFKTEDQNWVVSITSSFLALKTTAYHDYDDFWSRLQPVVAALEALYSPPFYTRVGLRYVNHMVREREGEEPVKWSRWLNQRISGEYTDPDLCRIAAESKHHVVLYQPRGLIGWRYSRDVGETEGKIAERFTLDFDHFCAGHIPTEEVSGLLRDFNEAAFRLFMWCLTPEGARLFDPKAKVRPDLDPSPS